MNPANRKRGVLRSSLIIVQLSLLLLCVAGEAAASTSSQYWTNAQSVHNCVVTNFGTTYGGYRIQTNSSTSYEWYVASQIYADSAMMQCLCGDVSYLPYVTNAFKWMTNLWNASNPSGGYFAAANINGTGAGGGKYVDDNALTGCVFLDCYEVSSGTMKTQFLNSAKSAANWLMYSGQWDNTFGGGFWWNEAKQNKPTQSNGLAMQLFLRLYQITGQTFYLDWANSVKGWLETQMFNSTNGLYVWQITTNGTPAGAKSFVEFTYDNAIMIEADLLYHQVLNKTPPFNTAYRTKAQNLASSLNARLWNNTYGCYYFNTADSRVNPCWCGWASQSLIKLHQADGNTNWLNYAQRNID